MDTLKRTSAQLRQYYVSTTPRLRIAFGLLLAVIVAGGAFLAQQGTSDSYAYLFGEEPFASSQIPQVAAALSTVGNDFEIDGNRVRVPRSKRNAYIAAVVNAGALPRNLDSIMTEAHEGGNVLDALESRETKRWRNQALRESQLSHIIGLMPWVEQASVIFTIEEPHSLSREQAASATVSVLPKPGELLDSQRLRNLQRLVAGWHPSLHHGKVTVINLGDENGTVSEATSDDSGDETYRILTSYEKHMRDSIREVLSYIPGIRIQVSARLGNPAELADCDVKPIQRAGIAAASVATEPATPVTVAGEGSPDLDAQGPNHRGKEVATDALSKSETVPTNHLEKNAPGVSDTESRRTGYQVITAFASIAVPRDYIVQVWKQRQVSPAEQTLREPDDRDLHLIQTDEIRKIKTLVGPLLPRLAQTKEQYEQLHVEVMPSTAGEPPPQPTLASDALGWTGRHWTALSLLGLTAIGLLLLRTVVRKCPRATDLTAVGASHPRLAVGESAGTASPELAAELKKLAKPIYPSRLETERRCAPSSVSEIGDVQFSDAKRIISVADQGASTVMLKLSEQTDDSDQQGSTQRPPDSRLNSQLAELRQLAAATHSPVPPFQTLLEADLRTLSEFLEREHAQTVAVVLSYLSAETAAEILDEMSGPRQAEVIQRLSELGETDPESLRVVEQNLDAWLAVQRREQIRNSDRMETVRSILAATQDRTRQSVLLRLRRQDDPLARQIESQLPRNSSPNCTERGAPAEDEFCLSPETAASAPHNRNPADGRLVRKVSETPSTCARISFDDLAKLSAVDLTAVFCSVERETVRCAFLGASDQLLAQVNQILTRQERKQFKQQLRSIGPIRLRDVEAARRAITDNASKMASQGMIKLPRQLAV